MVTKRITKFINNLILTSYLFNIPPIAAINYNEEIYINNIKTTKQEIAILPANTLTNNTVKDNSAALSIELPNKESNTNNTIFPNNILIKDDNLIITLEKNIEYTVTAKDNTGNENTISIKVDNNKGESYENNSNNLDKNNSFNVSSNNEYTKGHKENTENENREEYNYNTILDEELSYDTFSWKDCNKKDKFIIIITLGICIFGLLSTFVIIYQNIKEDNNDNC